MTSPAIVSVPLRHLKLSPLNVRQRPYPEDEIAELKASIRAHGLKQNLVIHKKGREFHVHAGGKRLFVLQSLQADDEYPKDHEVNCLVESREEALETSLIENFARSKMHVADEFRAFDTIIRNGRSVEEVAARFGTTIRFVESRMRLARLSPKILEEFSAGNITYDAVKAFTLTDDHARQDDLLERFGPNPQEWQIRNALSDKKVKGSSAIARFIDQAAYEAEGGAVTPDLFNDKDRILFDDPELVERLALAKLKVEADKLQKEWKWAETMLRIPYDAFHRYGRVYPEPLPLPDDLAEEQEKVQVRIVELEDIDEDAWTDEMDEEYRRLQDRDEEIAEIAQKTCAYAAEQKALAGVVVSIDTTTGGFRYEYGLVRPEDKPKIPKEQKRSTAGKQLNPVQAARADAGETISVVEDIRAIRHQVLRTHLAADFNTAFDALLYSMCVQIFGMGYSVKAIDVSLKSAEVARSREYLTGTVAEEMLKGLEAGLTLDWLNLDQPHDFIALSALSPREKQQLFAWCAAVGVEQSLSTDPGANPVLEVIGHRMEVDVASCWRPTAENYWQRVKKGYALKIAADLIGPKWADDHAKLRKGEIAAAMESAFDDDPQKSAGLDQGATKRTSTWLPDGMAFTGEYVERKTHRRLDREFTDTMDDDPDGDVEEADSDDGDEVGAESVIEKDADAAIGSDEDGDIPAFLQDAAE